MPTQQNTIPAKNIVCIQALIVTLVAIIITINANGQFTSSGYEVGINAGTLVYQGELTPKFYGYTKSLKPAIGLYGSKLLSSYFAVRANLMFGKVVADESKYATPQWRQYRAYKFSSRFTELSASLVFKPFGESNAKSFRRLSPYVFAGAGVSFLHVKRDWSRFDTSYFGSKSAAVASLAADTLHNVPKAIVVLPVGFGLTYMLSLRLALNAEATWRLTSTDYLDGFKYSDKYNGRDSYYGLSIGVSYRFGNNNYMCPPVKK